MTDHSDLIERIAGYLATGGLFNPELANHDAVRDLLIESRDAFSSQSLSLSEEREEIERLKGLVAGIREIPQEPSGVDDLRADLIGLRARTDGRRKLGISDCETEGDGEELATLTVPLLMLERVVGALEAKAPRVVVNPWDGCFDAAMQAVLCGGRASRKDWNRPSHIELRTVEGFSNAVVVMVMRDGSAGPYTPSGCDMVAHDWEMPNG